VQTVSFANEKSAESTVMRGVPQGSVLGPTTLCTQIAASKNINVYSYADDTQLYIHCNVSRVHCCVKIYDIMNNLTAE